MRLLVSRCLLGEPCRYDGRAKPSLLPTLLEMGFRAEDLIAVCPECDGGLPTPRAPSELIGGTAEDVLEGRANILSVEGADNTAAYRRGANGAYHRDGQLVIIPDGACAVGGEGPDAAETAEKNGIRIALLKAKSPSCSPDGVYDGTFSGRLVPGQGLTAALLRRRGLEVFSEETLDALSRLKDSHSAEHGC